MGNSNNLLHAEHNEDTCKYLRRKPDFLDWVITTAFYSAMHYLRYKMMPQTETISSGTVTFNDFETYYNACKTFHQGRHGFQAEKVRILFPEISADYSHLKDICENARYYNYQYDRAASELAYKRLQTIKTFCLQ
jgi:spermidine synthase